MTDLEHVDNMRVSQAYVHHGDVRFYVTTANRFVVRGPFDTKDEALTQLDEIRSGAYAEAEEENALRAEGWEIA